MHEREHEREHDPEHGETCGARDMHLLGGVHSWRNENAPARGFEPRAFVRGKFRSNLPSEKVLGLLKREPWPTRFDFTIAGSW